jgi:hypothetical protein
MPDKASTQVMDFTNVREGGGEFNKLHQRAGGYVATVTKVKDAPAKSDGTMQWLFTLKAGAGTYPYYCKHVENQLWKVRNLFVAAGLNVPKKRVKVDPNLVVGKKVGIILEDDEYDGRAQSNIQAIVPLSELEESPPDDDDDDEDEDEKDVDEDEEEAPAPAAKKSKAKAKPAPVDDDDDDDLEEIDIDEL